MVMSNPYNKSSMSNKFWTFKEISLLNLPPFEVFINIFNLSKTAISCFSNKLEIEKLPKGEN